MEKKIVIKGARENKFGDRVRLERTFKENVNKALRLAKEKGIDDFSITGDCVGF